MGSECLIIIAKNPVYGKVKTRLAQTLGNDKALSVYIDLLNHTLRESSEGLRKKIVYFDSHLEKAHNLPAGFQQKVQATGDLGVRLHSALTDELKDCRKAIIVGSDCPTLTAEIIDSAFHLLDRRDVVLGPASDGGYYLIGMKHDIPELFHDIPWSTNRVLNVTLEKLKRGGFTVDLLPELSDVDTEEDWNRWCKNL